MKKGKEYYQLRDSAMERDGHKCIIRGCDKGPKYLNLSHILPEEFTKYSLNLDNVLMLCPGHHKLGNFSAHKNPIWFTTYLKTYQPRLYLIAKVRLQILKNKNGI